MVNKGLIRPAISGGGGYVRGGWLISHNRIHGNGIFTYINS